MIEGNLIGLRDHMVKLFLKMLLHLVTITVNVTEFHIYHVCVENNNLYKSDGLTTEIYKQKILVVG